jgi:hypothetical protein
MKHPFALKVENNFKCSSIDNSNNVASFCAIQDTVGVMLHPLWTIIPRYTFCNMIECLF